MKWSSKALIFQKKLAFDAGVPERGGYLWYIALE